MSEQESNQSLSFLEKIQLANIYYVVLICLATFYHAINNGYETFDPDTPIKIFLSILGLISAFIAFLFVLQEELLAFPQTVTEALISVIIKFGGFLYLYLNGNSFSYCCYVIQISIVIGFACYHLILLLFLSFSNFRKNYYPRYLTYYYLRIFIITGLLFYNLYFYKAIDIFIKNVDLNNYDQLLLWLSPALISLYSNFRYYFRTYLLNPTEMTKYVEDRISTSIATTKSRKNEI